MATRQQEPEREQRYRPSHFVLSGPPAQLDMVERNFDRYAEALGLDEIDAVPAFAAFMPSVSTWTGEGWAPRKIDYRGDQPDLQNDTRLYRFSPELDSGEETCALVKRLAVLVREDPELEGVAVCCDDVVTNPEQGAPGPEQGAPGPEQGAPGGGGGGSPCTPSPGWVDTPLGTQYALQRAGVPATKKYGASETGKGVTVVVIDCFPIFGEKYDIGGSYLDYLVEVDPALLNEEAVPAGHEAPDADCPFVEKEKPAENTPDVAYTQALPYHGTLVASLIRTIASDARVVGVRAINNNGLTYTSVLAAILRWLIQGPLVDGRPLVEGDLVVNLSLGLFRTQKEIVESCCMFVNVDQAAEHGVWFVAAAGNDSDYRPENPVEPAAYGFYSDSAATADRVIPVAGTFKHTEFARFSNDGTIGALANCVVMDPDINPALPRTPQLLNPPPATPYLRWHGTSFATPQATGVLALLLSKSSPPADPKQHLWETAHLPIRWNGVRELCASGALAGVPCGDEETPAGCLAALLQAIDRALRGA